MIRVLLVDDHSMVREGLRLFLADDPELNVVAEAANGNEAVRLAQRLRPDVVLMDVLMPGMDGIAATAIIRQHCPETSVIILSSLLDQETVVRAVKAGASGYLLKDIEEADLRRALKEAVAGRIQLPQQVSVYLLRELQSPEHGGILTEREVDVLRLLARGESNKDIARHLHVVEDTVKSHVRHILSKLGVRSRTQAALYAIRQGLVSAEP